MKKLILLIFTIITLISFSNLVIASGSDVNEPIVKQEAEINNGEAEFAPEEDSEKTDDNEMSPAGEEIIGAVSKKDKKIADLEIKYNNKTLAVVAYYLEVVRFYSTPIFFIFLTMGAFNFFIVGNKKLDKKEQGFGWITACIIGWVFFQCVPLVFALFAI